MQVGSRLMCQLLPLQGRVYVHFHPGQLQHEEVLARQAASAPQPALLGQPEALPRLQLGTGQCCPPLANVLHMHTLMSDLVHKP